MNAWERMDQPPVIKTEVGQISNILQMFLDALFFKKITIPPPQIL